MNAVLAEILRTGQCQTPDGSKVTLQAAVTPDEGAFLQGLIREVKPRTTLEVGMAYGVSTLFICDALREVGGNRHIAIDPNQHGGPWGHAWNGIGIGNVARAGYSDLVDLIELPSYQALPRLVEQGTRIDFAFIDGWHTFDYALLDFFYIDLMLEVGGVVVLDDASWAALRKLERYILRNRAYTKCGKTPWRIGRNLAELKHTVRALAAKEFGSTCVALRKQDVDKRHWHFHASF